MKFVALLRGINVGGNMLIKMSELKVVFEECGFKNVITYINSGNVIFESDKKDTKVLEVILEKAITNGFHFDVKVVVRSEDELREVIADVPNEWKRKHDLRCYIAFVKAPVTSEEVLKEVQLKEGVDSARAGKYALYMSTKLSGITKSGFTKLAGKNVYKDITIRNYNTSQKLLTLLEK